MTTDFGLKETGYIAPSFAEILDGVEDDYRTRLGDDIALTSNAYLGIFARLMSDASYDLIQQQELIYYSGFYSTATDSALDRLAGNINLTRKVDAPAHAEVVITTEGEYLIQAGEKFETEDGLVFDLTEDVITSKQSDGLSKELEMLNVKKLVNLLMYQPTQLLCLPTQMKTLFP
ncbi:Phage Mu gp47 related protein [Lactobacillus acidophilus]|nr:Phage Mu gp47 related protein [Lactobacillus acidophilus]